MGLTFWPIHSALCQCDEVASSRISEQIDGVQDSSPVTISDVPTVQVLWVVTIRALVPNVDLHCISVRSSFGAVWGRRTRRDEALVDWRPMFFLPERR